MKGSTCYWLELILKSDANLGRGDGVAGLVDDEVKHDRFGLPYLSGKTLKGLLVAQCAEILFGLKQCKVKNLGLWEETAGILFGVSGSRATESGILAVGDACIPADLYMVVAKDFQPIEALTDAKERSQKWGTQQAANLEALTALRRQTAIDARTGAPLRNSLRTVRVVLRTTRFIASIESRQPLSTHQEGLLAACVCALHRAGGNRNRGSGKLGTHLYDAPLYDPITGEAKKAEPVTPKWLEKFEKEVLV
jgi:hypothetical protein